MLHSETERDSLFGPHRQLHSTVRDNARQDEEKNAINTAARDHNSTIISA